MHVSTDWVHSEFGTEFPVNAYGLQKLLAEKNVELAFGKNRRGYLICRASSLFGHTPARKTFIHRFLLNCFRQAVNSKDGKVEVGVVSDVKGYPTSVEFLSRFIINAALKRLYGVCEVRQYANGFHTESSREEYQMSRLEWAAQIRNETISDNFRNITVGGAPFVDFMLNTVLVEKTQEMTGMQMPRSFPYMRGIDDRRLLRDFSECVPRDMSMSDCLRHFIQTEIFDIAQWIDRELSAEEKRAVARIVKNASQKGKRKCLNIK